MQNKYYLDKRECSKCFGTGYNLDNEKCDHSFTQADLQEAFSEIEKMKLELYYKREEYRKMRRIVLYGSK